MTPRLIPFAAEHVALLTDDALQMSIAGEMARLGPGRTLVEDGRVVAAAGLARLWPGVAEAWLLLHRDLTPRQRLTVTRAISRGLPPLLREEGLRRLQASVRVDFERGRHLVEWLGMKPEGVMRGYGSDGADHVRYAWVAG